MNEYPDKPFPPFLRNYKFYLSGKSIKNADEQLLRAIAFLYTTGWTFEEVNSVSEIYACVKYIQNEMHVPNYPFAQDLIKHIFTTGTVMNPFGPWLKFEYYDPYFVLRYATYILKKKGKGNLQPAKFAGFIFSILAFSQIMNFRNVTIKKENLLNEIAKDCYSDVAKKEKQDLLLLIEEYSKHKDIGYISQPNIFYRLAGITQRNMRQYCQILDIKIIYGRFTLKGEFKVTLWLANYRQILKSFEEFKKKQTIDFNLLNKLRRGEISSGINFYEGNEEKERIIYEYERRLGRDKTSLFNLGCLPQNPFIRIMRDYEAIFFFTQLELTDYIALLISLYKTLPARLLPGISKYRRIRPRKYKDNVYHKLSEYGFDRDIFPISSLEDTIDRGRHFDQIEESRAIISRISEAGIAVDLPKCRSLLMDIQQRIKSIESNPTTNLISEDIDIYKKNNFNADETEEEENQIITSLDELKYKEAQLIKLISSATDWRNKIGETRIRGYFTPHGASTHRMTCRNINLQGIPEDIRNEIIIAPRNYVLISVDVSGQDITIAANLAYRLFNELENFPVELYTEINALAKICKNTLLKLKAPYRDTDKTARPIDHITDMIIQNSIRYNSFTATYEPIEISREEIRALVKTSVYVLFYGGGEKTIGGVEKAVCERMIKLILEDIEKFNVSELFDDTLLVELSKATTYEKTIEHLQILYKSSLDFGPENHYSDYLTHLRFRIGSLLEEIERLKLHHFKKVEVFRDVKKFIGSEYPGILESFKYYRKYYWQIEENQANFKLTYRTLLGWQTCFPYIAKGSIAKRHTKSLSYPIQASGAEFIRQWLIELSHARGYGESWEIINVIHDQVIVEAKRTIRDRVEIDIFNAARTAAEKIGIDSHTLQFSDPEIIIGEKNQLFL